MYKSNRTTYAIYDEVWLPYRSHISRLMTLLDMYEGSPSH